MSPAQNHLIAALPQADRKRLLQAAEPADLVLFDVLADAGQRTSHVYFPVDGFVSLLRPVDGQHVLEVGMVGREGMVGAQLCLTQAPTQLRALVQGAGTAHRVRARDFLAQIAASAALRRTMNRYVHVLMEQLATSAGCLRFHLIGARLARWLLMTHDRARTDSFRVTQEFLAHMLGVRRVGVTAAARMLQRQGLIVYDRGALTVLDRPGLEAAACSCYRSDLQAYAGVLSVGSAQKTDRNVR